MDQPKQATGGRVEMGRGASKQKTWRYSSACQKTVVKEESEKRKTMTRQITAPSQEEKKKKTDR